MTTREPDLVDGVPRGRIVVASMVGTTIEFYDFYAYATAAVVVFPHLFFPKGDPTTALLASLATFGLAFVARPLGSILFGHFGDRIGRKTTLVASLLVMGIATSWQTFLVTSSLSPVRILTITPWRESASMALADVSFAGSKKAM